MDGRINELINVLDMILMDCGNNGKMNCWVFSRRYGTPELGNVT